MTDTNPSVTLDAIRVGGSKLLALARVHLAEIERALDRGHFNEAVGFCGDLHRKLAPLAEAEMSLGILTRASVMRVQDVKPGMNVAGGKVIDVEVEDHSSCPPGCRHAAVILQWEDGTEREYELGHEVVVDER